MYHHIAEQSGFNTVSIRDFSAHLEYLSLSHFQVISLEEYVSNLTKRKLNNPVALTFDDAYTSIPDLAMPLLEKYGFPMNFFVPVDFMGKYNVWDAKTGKPQIEIMDWDSISNLNSSPLVTIGSHGMGHVSLGQQTESQVTHELRASKIQLESRPKTPISYFSFPYGQWINLPPLVQYKKKDTKPDSQLFGEGTTRFVILSDWDG